MTNHNRYDRLVSRIRRDFEKFRTESVTVSGGDRELIANADDEDWASQNDPFSRYAPYNTVSVTNDGDSALRVYLDRRQNFYFDVQPGDSRQMDKGAYFAFLSLENQGTSASDAEVTFGRMIDSRELELLKMSGMLNLEG